MARARYGSVDRDDAIAANGCHNVSVNQNGHHGADQYSPRKQRLIERMRRYASPALWDKFEAELDELEQRCK